MKADIDAGLFLESACVHGNYYGTSKSAVKEVQREGKVCILDIDVQGVSQVKASDLAPKYLWVEVPSLEILEGRLRGRGTETEEKIQKRLRNAKNELAFAHPDNGDKPFDHYLVNDDLDRAFSELKTTLTTWYPHLSAEEEEVPPSRGGPCAVVTNLFRKTTTTKDNGHGGVRGAGSAN